MDTDSELSGKRARLTWLRGRLRREGSLAAALVQSMALAVIGTAGAYPSWVLVKDADEESRDIVLGASWAVTRIDPEPDSPLLGGAGGPIMFAIASCCLLSVGTGSLALTVDFLGRRRGRSWAPLLHGVTAVLIASAAAGGSCLLALVRGRVRSEPALLELELSTSPGQSLFLSFLACALAATATGLSCSSPARVQPARSSWDLGRAGGGGGAARDLGRPEEERASTLSLESLVWQEGRLSALLLDSPRLEDEQLRPRWYDYTAPEPRAALGSRHSLLRGESRVPARSVEFRCRLPAPTPSAATLPPQEEDAAGPAPSPEEGTPQEDAPGPGPSPAREPEPERLPPPAPRESLTWREAVASDEGAEDEPRSDEPGSEGVEAPLLPEEQARI